jgi:hypothetical protein
MPIVKPFQRGPEGTDCCIGVGAKTSRSAAKALPLEPAMHKVVRMEYRFTRRP